MTVYEQMNATIDQIMTDETLTDQLDDQAAKRLLSWGLTLIANIRGEEDEVDEDALLDTSDEARIFAGLETIPELIDFLNCWLGADSRSPEVNEQKLAAVLEQMRVIQANFKPPARKFQQRFLKEISGESIMPEEKIRRLIELF